MNPREFISLLGGAAARRRGRSRCARSSRRRSRASASSTTRPIGTPSGTGCETSATLKAATEVRNSYFPNKAGLPPSTVLQILRLANPNYLVEVDVIAAVPRL